MDFFEILKEVNQQELVDFIVGLAQKRDDIAILVRSRFSRSDGDLELKELNQDMRDIFYNHQDRSGFISYYAARRFIQELSDFLEDSVKQLVCASKCWIAFQLLCKATLKLDKLAIDDSDGGLLYLIKLICDCWQKCIPQLEDSQKKEAFRWFKKRIENHDIDLFWDNLFRSFFDFFKDREFRKAQIKLLDTLMEELSQSQNQTDPKTWDYSATCKLEKYCAAGFHCRKDLNASKEELLSYLLPLSYLKEPCWLVVEVYREHGEFTSAEKLLLDFITANESHIGYVSRARKLLQEVYDQMGDKDSQQKNLFIILVNNSLFDSALYQKYKDFFSPQQWPQQRENLIASISSDTYNNSIFIHEGLTERLLQSVIDSQKRYPSIYDLKLYAPKLSCHIEELLPFFEISLNQEAQRATSRPMYREVAGDLVFLSKFDGGQNLARELKAQWMEKYKRKSAFLDELGKIL